jgi:hypothetical protein
VAGMPRSCCFEVLWTDLFSNGGTRLWFLGAMMLYVVEHGGNVGVLLSKSDSPRRCVSGKTSHVGSVQ